MLKRILLIVLVLTASGSAFAAPKPVQAVKAAVKKVVDVVKPHADATR